jgi:DNA helicase-2/ATP-dependent DNA helicase PcrA
MTDSLLAALNPQQHEAVITTDGPLLVAAGAGSGKTRVITHRIAWLIDRCGVPPWQVFAATFTNKAAEEMRERVGRLLPGSDIARLTIATFHSICVGILRREAAHVGLGPRFTICDDTDQMALIKDCLRNLGEATHGRSGGVRPEEVRSWIGAAKVLMLDPEQARKQMPQDQSPLCAQVYEQYQNRLLANDAVDFDDLILHVVRIFQDHPDVLAHYQDRWRYLLVDEYQDTNRVQFELIRLLAGKHGNICVVGDEDQSIYSWRGAEIENLLSFPDLFEGTRIVRLEQNYRSTETILQAADHVISHNTQRMAKTLWSERGAGEPITMIAAGSEREEAAQVVATIGWLRRWQGRPLRSMAIFYRVNALSRVFEDQLRQRGFPYRVIGGIKFYDRAEVKDLLAYLRLCVNPRDSIALARVVNKPTRGVGAKSLAEIYNEAVRLNVSLWDVLLAIRDKRPDAPTVSSKARAGIADFTLRVADWSEWARTHTPEQVLEKILRETGYEESLGGDRDLEAISRRENIAELASALEEYHKAEPAEGLDGFLERVALVNAQDRLTDEDALSLMSLHCAKGLEYDVVFLVGMEDPIFPSQRAVTEQGHFEEERRLFYVGITRAKDLLFLSRADSRLLHGRPTYNTPSLFLREIPGELMRSLDDARELWAEQASRRQRAGVDAAAPALREAARDTPGDALPEVQIGERLPTFSGTNPETGAFAIGSRVAHARLGEGEVVGATGAGDRRKVTVRFDAGLQLEILERYGGLEPAVEDDLPY